MGATISAAALVLLFASADAEPKLPASPLSLQDSVMSHAVQLPEKDTVFQLSPWRRSSQAFATWGGPWTPRPDIYDRPDFYDQHYVTW